MSLRGIYVAERSRAIRALRSIDRQTAFVLVTCPLLVFLQFGIGNRRRFLEQAAGYIPDHLEGLASWSWWFGIQGISGFLLPVLFLTLLFRRRLRDVGLSLGDWRFGLTMTALYLPLVVVGTWILSDSVAFQRAYPHLNQAAHAWDILVAYEFMFLLYWIGWEYLWRGYVIFGTAHKLGIYAIFVQAVPFAILHIAKPPAEAVLSVLGGLVLGAVVWRCRSFWYAVPIHALQMLSIDLWCTLRIRTGVEGKGLASLLETFRQL